MNQSRIAGALMAARPLPRRPWSQRPPWPDSMAGAAVSPAPREFPPAPSAIATATPVVDAPAPGKPTIFGKLRKTWKNWKGAPEPQAIADLTDPRSPMAPTFDPGAPARTAAMSPTPAGSPPVHVDQALSLYTGAPPGVASADFTRCGRSAAAAEAGTPPIDEPGFRGGDLRDTRRASGLAAGAAGRSEGDGGGRSGQRPGRRLSADRAPSRIRRGPRLEHVRGAREPRFLFPRSMALSLVRRSASRESLTDPGSLRRRLALVSCSPRAMKGYCCRGACRARGHVRCMCSFGRGSASESLWAPSIVHMIGDLVGDTFLVLSWTCVVRSPALGRVRTRVERAGSEEPMEVGLHHDWSSRPRQVT